MKKTFTFIAFLLFIQLSGFAQVKVDEYERLDSDSESGRMDNFLIELQNNPESKGLIVQYVNSKQIGFGNLSSHIKGVKEYIKLRGFPDTSIQIKVGITRKELWIYPKGVDLPRSDSLKLEPEDLSKPLAYAHTCIECSPAVPLLSWNYIDLEQYAKFIKTNDNYRALVVIHQANVNEWTKKERYQNAIDFVVEYRKILVEKYGIPKNKLKIVIRKPIVDDNSPGIAEFYIVPNKK